MLAQLVLAAGALAATNWERNYPGNLSDDLWSRWNQGVLSWVNETVGSFHLDSFGPVIQCPANMLEDLGGHRACVSHLLGGGTHSSSGCVIISASVGSSFEFEIAFMLNHSHCSLHTLACQETIGTTLLPSAIASRTTNHDFCLGDRNGVIRGKSFQSYATFVSGIGLTHRPTLLRLDLGGMEWEVLQDLASAPLSPVSIVSRVNLQINGAPTAQQTRSPSEIRGLSEHMFTRGGYILVDKLGPWDCSACADIVLSRISSLTSWAPLASGEDPGSFELRGVFAKSYSGGKVGLDRDLKALTGTRLFGVVESSASCGKFDATAPHVACPPGLLQVFGSGTSSRHICSHASKSGDCVAIFAGTHAEWSVEFDFLSKHPHCSVHVIDCSPFSAPVPDTLQEQISFHEVCLGTSDKVKSSTYQTFIKTIGLEVRPTVLVLDLGGSELEVLENIVQHKDNGNLLPLSLSVKVHLSAFGTEPISSALALSLDYLRTRGGYAAVSRHDGPSACAKYSEFTFAHLLTRESAVPALFFHHVASSATTLGPSAAARNRQVEDPVAPQCAAVADSLRQLVPKKSGITTAQHSVVYQCRAVYGDSDDCGGFGDRLAGLFGATFLAMSTNRSIFFDWTGLQDFFRTNVVDWDYDAATKAGLLSSASDLKVLSLRIDTRTPQMNESVPFLPIPGLSSDSAVISGLNLQQPVLFSRQTWWSAMKPHRVVYLHSNRGLNAQWVADQTKLEQHHAWPKEMGVLRGGHWIQMYSCLFSGLFGSQPTEALLGSTYRLMRADGKVISVDYRQVWEVASQEFSVAVHWRQSDNLARLDQLGPASGKPQVEGEGLTCRLRQESLDAITNLAKQHRPAGKKSVLVLSTNSLRTIKQVSEYFAGQTVFDYVYVQSLEGEIHMNPKEFQQITPNVREFDEQRRSASIQTMRDWWLLKSADVLFADFKSGFSASAGLVASSDQHLYMFSGIKWKGKAGKGCAIEGGGAAPVTPEMRPDILQKTALCAGRFCRRRSRVR